jgi:sugar lactone lactonase YvrE
MNKAMLDRRPLHRTSRFYRRVSLTLLALLALYLCLWPVPVEPVSWTSPMNPGYAGPYQVNERLSKAALVSVAPRHGPEALAVGPDGWIYTGTEDGTILRFSPKTKAIELVAQTGGRPLGLAFGRAGQLYIADAYLGLLRLDSHGEISVLADRFRGEPIRYADDLDVDVDGRIYFSDASTGVSPRALKSSFEASRLDINEHGAKGRLFVFDPTKNELKLLLDGLNFANGVTLSHDGHAVLVCETGHYRVVRYWLHGPKAGRSDILIKNLPGFPDNIKRGSNGRYWLGLVSPRSAALDALSAYPSLRKMVFRLPRWLQPDARAYGHILSLDDAGRVHGNLQDPTGRVAFTTGAIEIGNHLYVSSLHRREIAIIPLAATETETPQHP